MAIDPPDLLEDAARRARRYLVALPERRVSPAPEDVDALTRFNEPLPDESSDAHQTLALLDELGGPGTVASMGGRYFGFVTGAALPAALAAHWLASAWDQNTALEVMSPAASAIENVALSWSRDLLRLPDEAHGLFVTGTTMGNFCGLAAARSAVLEGVGWDVGARGMNGAPPIQVVVGEQAHAVLFRALSLLGFGRDNLIRVPVDDQGRMLVDELPVLEAPSIVCIQAGNVDSGAFDPATEICQAARKTGAWVHVDGAFGLWAAAAPERAHLMTGFELADSWATDAHKWLNVPYDCGIAFVRNTAALGSAMAMRAPYLSSEHAREPLFLTPEGSRRARGIDVWAALRVLGRRGVAELVERNCRQAARLARKLADAGCEGLEVLNEVVLNQVLVAFGDDDRTRRIIDELQREGTCWCGGSTWKGRAVMRVSLSSWATTDDDLDRTIAAIVRQAA